MLWSIGVYDLGLTSEAFWSLTPRQFVALLDRHHAAERRADARAALVAAVLVNLNRKKGSKAATVDDFMPKPAKEKSQKVLDEAALREIAMAMQRGRGGAPSRT